MMMRRRLWWVVVVVVMAVLGVLVAVGLRAVRDNAADVTAAQTEIASLRDAVALANGRLEAQGSVPVAIPDVVIPEAGEPGSQGERGYQGATGLPGRIPTAAEIAASVTTYCTLGDNCVGPIGPAGARGDTGEPGQSIQGDPGAAGADSTVPGPPGADSTIPGPAGPAGANGADSAPGRGLAALDCVDDGAGSTYWVVTYTDGATAAITGPCRVP